MHLTGYLFVSHKQGHLAFASQLKTFSAQINVLFSQSIAVVSRPHNSTPQRAVGCTWEQFKTIVKTIVTECNVCVHGHGPLTFFLFLFFFSPVVLSLFWLGGSFMALIIRSVKTCALGRPRPLSPRVPGEGGRRLVWAAAGAPMRLIQGRACK